MNNISYNFERFEKKYVLTKQQYQEFFKQIAPYIENDLYGKYTICNLYFDTNTYELIRESIQKPYYKEKMRMRSYGVPTIHDTVYLELKKKVDSTVYKRRISCTLQEAEAFLQNGTYITGNDQVFHELAYFMNFYHPYPKLYLAYDRNAYQGIVDSTLRITFDFNIRSRSYALQLDKGDEGHVYFPEQNVIMEIKVAQSLPLWLVTILSKMQLYPASFSKYGSVYCKDIVNKEFGGNVHV